MGPPRHLALLPGLGGERVEWPVPFADGVERLLGLRGRRVAVLVSGDPFWFGAGAVLARHLAPEEWRALPGVSTFSLAASRAGWALEDAICAGLHAAPFARLRPALAPGARAIVLLRDGAAVADLARWLTGEGFGATRMRVMEALGGPRERVRGVDAKGYGLDDVGHPVCVALEVAGSGTVLPLASGRPDDWFSHDGQITKRPVRALTLSALAPRPGEHLWDIGAGSGSIAIEWLLAHPTLTATAVEAVPERAVRISHNAAAFGLTPRLNVLTARAPEGLDAAEAPQAIFVGGGLTPELLDRLWARMPAGCRLVANAVTLETEALLARSQGEKGGTLLRFELAKAGPLGRRRGWKSAYPVVQWSVAR